MPWWSSPGLAVAGLSDADSRVSPALSCGAASLAPEQQFRAFWELRHQRQIQSLPRVLSFCGVSGSLERLPAWC